MTFKSDELKACPKCGAPVTLLKSGTRPPVFSIRCNKANCLISTDFKPQRHLVIERWNSRPLLNDNVKRSALSTNGESE